MMMGLLIMTMKMMTNLNPIKIAITILVISIVTMMPVLKSTLSSWVPFVTILTFSSGMMTLFMYTASLSSNETSKTKKIPFIFMSVMLFVLSVPSGQNSQVKHSMKTFSNKMTIMLMAVLLILSMLAISTHGHHPNQTVSSSF